MQAFKAQMASECNALLAQLPPHSVEAEAGMLACVTLDANFASEIAPDMFYDIRHQILASVMIDMASHSKSLETISLVHELATRGQLNACGGVAYVSQIPEATPSVYQFPQWKKELLELAGRRRILAAASKAITLAHDLSEPYENVIDLVERESLSLRGQNSVGALPFPEPRNLKSIAHALPRGKNLTRRREGAKGREDLRTTNLH